jgi:signal transduction histidine kinase
MLRAAMDTSTECKNCTTPEAVNMIAHRIGHDLRAPLRALKILPEWISEEFESAETDIPPKAQQFLEMITSKAIQMEGLLAGLLEYALVADPEARVSCVDIPAEIDEVARRYLDEGAYEIEVASELSTLVLIREDLSTVFRHLISNAVLHNDQCDLHVRVTGQLHGATAIFCVEDNGPGIEKEFHQRIFEPFAMLKPRDEARGSGLGLAVAQKIADCWDGRITVRSELGKGSRFQFEFPVEACDLTLE